MPTSDKETYVLTLRALPDQVPAAIRMRSLLKRALRCYRLRCTKIEELLGTPTQEEKPVSVPVDLPEEQDNRPRRQY